VSVRNTTSLSKRRPAEDDRANPIQQIAAARNCFDGPHVGSTVCELVRVRSRPLLPVRAVGELLRRSDSQWRDQSAARHGHRKLWRGS